MTFMNGVAVAVGIVIGIPVVMLGSVIIMGAMVADLVASIIEGYKGSSFKAA